MGKFIQVTCGRITERGSETYEEGGKIRSCRVEEARPPVAKGRV
ncbi:MAG: hypothetical protein QHH75_01935 [Bacillota bacterium]|nr:hypothetical protein [Bacillota bacterium]